MRVRMVEREGRGRGARKLVSPIAMAMQMEPLFSDVADCTGAL